MHYDKQNGYNRADHWHAVRAYRETTLSRRSFLEALYDSAAGLLWMTALAYLSGKEAAGETTSGPRARGGGWARRVIYLYQLGAPSQIDLFDYKPQLARWHGKELPGEVRGNQRLTAFTANQGTWPIAATPFRFRQHGQSGVWLSELLPHLGTVVDQLCFIRSMHTEAINHVTGSLLAMTGVQRPGRPSLGAWVQYGLGHESEDLPAFVVLTSKGSAWRGGEALQSQLWSNGFLPTRYQGVAFRPGSEPVLYLQRPAGVTAAVQQSLLDTLEVLNQSTALPAYPGQLPRPTWQTAFQMQVAVPELLRLDDESESVLEMYGPDVYRPGSFAYNCLLARRLVERGVRFVQLFHRGWDHHERINQDHPLQARDVDQPSAALVRDLKQRGLLEDTLVVWGSEFGRTVFCQGSLHSDHYGRDHHPRCFTVWLAGGGIRSGYVHGTTDEFSYNVIEHPVHVHDLNATILHCLGLDHERLTFRHQGREFRLTDVSGQVVYDILN
jgi:hypothetical protein